RVDTLLDLVLDLAAVGVGLLFQLFGMAAARSGAIGPAHYPRLFFDAVVGPFPLADAGHEAKILLPSPVDCAASRGSAWLRAGREAVPVPFEDLLFDVGDAGTASFAKPHRAGKPARLCKPVHVPLAERSKLARLARRQ